MTIRRQEELELTLVHGAVLIIQKGMAKVVNIKNQDLTTKIVDMVPDLINRFTSKKADDPAVDEAVDDILNDDKK